MKKNPTKRLVIGVAVILAVLGGAAVFAGGPRGVVAQEGTTGPYYIPMLFPPGCDVLCGSYNIRTGCMCYRLPPIIVEVPKK